MSSSETLSLRWDALAAVLLGLLLVSSLWLKGRKPLYLALRAAALLLILWLALEPTVKFSKQSSQKASLAVLVDVSRSMGIEDPSERLSRVKEALKVSQKVLEKGFDVSYYEFAEHCSKADLKEILKIKPQGEKTGIGKALEHVAQEFKGGRPAVLLFSDGVDNVGGPEPVYDSPVFSVLVGQKGSILDLALKDLRGSDFAFKNRPAEFRVTVQNSGFKGRKVPVLLKEKKGQGWADFQVKEVLLSEAAGEQELVFRIVPQAPGLYEYKIEAPVQPNEISRSNNVLHFKLQVGREKIRVLYLCGQPSPEYAFLRQLLKSDPAVELVSFVILRNPENVVPVPEEQLSLIPFPTHDIFVRTLADFDLLIFENFSYARFGILPAHLGNIERFIEEKGGGFLMIGGENSFSHGGYVGTAIERILPVVLNPSQEEIVPEEVRFKVLEPQHPVFDLGESLDRTEKIWKEVPALNGYYRLPSVRSGAALLAVSDSGHPLMAAWQRKKGRVLALASLSTWQWALGLSEKGFLQSPYTQFWRQTIRWLTSAQESKPLRIVLTESQFAVGQKAGIRLMVQPELLKKDQVAELELLIQREGKTVSVLPLTSAGRSEYRAEWFPDREGEFVIHASLKSGVKKYEDARVCEVKALDLEMDDPVPDPSLLKGIAASSNGKFMELAAFSPEVLKGEIKHIQAYKREEVQRPLWTNPWIFLVLVLSLLAEWGIRRYRGEI